MWWTGVWVRVRVRVTGVVGSDGNSDLDKGITPRQDMFPKRGYRGDCLCLRMKIKTHHGLAM